MLMLNGFQIPVLTPEQVIEHRARTFASITQPTWSEIKVTAIPGQEASHAAEAPHPEAAASPNSPSSSPTPAPGVQANQEPEFTPSRSGLPPSIMEARSAHADLSALLHPRHPNGKPGHLPFEAGDECL